MDLEATPTHQRNMERNKNILILLPWQTSSSDVPNAATLPRCIFAAQRLEKKSDQESFSRTPTQQVETRAAAAARTQPSQHQRQRHLGGSTPGFSAFALARSVWT